MKRCKAKAYAVEQEVHKYSKREKGNKDINIERTEDALEVSPNFIATGCPFCNTMMTDGIKNKEKKSVQSWILQK